MKAIIIDDEPDARENLQNLLNKYCDQVDVIDTADSSTTGIEKIKKHNPDLIFLDIQMPNGGGLELLETIDPINFEVVFVTAFDEYAIKAIKFSALDYILKPVDIEELKTAVSNAEARINDKQSDERIRLFLENQRTQPKKIALSTFEGMVFVAIEEIIRCEASDSYTKFILKNEDPIMISGSLKEYESMLSDANFFRVHQSHLINMDYVKKYVKGSGGHVVMIDDSHIGIARSKKQDFLNQLSRFNVQ